MDLHTIFLIILIILNMLVFILVTWTLYEFIQLGKEQFKYYIIGLFFYGLTVLSFFLLFIVFSPSNEIASSILQLLVFVAPFIGIFYFVKGTDYLAKKEKPDLIRDERLYNLVVYFTIILIVYDTIIVIIWSILPQIIADILDYSTYFLIAILLVLALKLLFEYKKAFLPPLDKIILQYILAVILLIGSGSVLTFVLDPIISEDLTFTDLSYLRNSIAVISASIILIPFIICFRSVSKFRKMLQG